MAVLAAAFFGLILGSFINALSFRVGTGRSVLHGRSRCMHCGHTLQALDLVPVLSYLLLGGRCRYCRTKVSLQYPLVELSAAALAAGVAWVSPIPVAFVFWLLIWMTLLFVVVYDLRHFIIPWNALGLLALLSLGYVCATYTDLWAFAAGPILAAPLFLISFFSGGRAMGWGDAPLEISLGWLLGLWGGFVAFLLAFWVGAAVGIMLLILRRGYTMKSELPFAPFLILGAAVAYFFHATLFTIPALLW